MTLNNAAEILRKGESLGRYECHVHQKTVTGAVQGGFVYQNEVLCRIPLESDGAALDAKCGDFLRVDGVDWKIVGVSVNKDGTQPHVRIVGV